MMRVGLSFLFSLFVFVCNGWGIRADVIWKQQKLQNGIRKPKFSGTKELQVSRCGFISKDGKLSLSSSMLPVYRFLAGGFAASIASTLTCPLEVVKINLQSSNAIGQTPLSVAKKIMAEEGFPGFFRGLNAFLIGIVPNRATYFWSYSGTKDFLSPFFGNTPITHLLSAVSAGISSNTFTNPIWVVKTRLQLEADPGKGQLAYKGWRDCTNWILKQEGIKGFYKGLSASYWGCAEGCIQFVAYERMKKVVKKKNAEEYAKETGQDSEPPTRLRSYQYVVLAGLSKFIANMSTYPYMVARTRMREQATSGIFKYTGMWSTIGTIAREEGWQSLYAGLGMHLARAIPHTAIMFLSYEIIDEILQKLKDDEDDKIINQERINQQTSDEGSAQDGDSLKDRELLQT